MNNAEKLLIEKLVDGRKKIFYETHDKEFKLGFSWETGQKNFFDNVDTDEEETIIRYKDNIVMRFTKILSDEEIKREIYKYMLRQKLKNVMDEPDTEK